MGKCSSRKIKPYHVPHREEEKMKNNWANRNFERIVESLKEDGFKFSGAVEDEMGVSIRSIPPAIGSHFWLRTTDNFILPRFCPPDNVTDILSAAVDQVLLDKTMQKFDLPLFTHWRQRSITAGKAAQIIAEAFRFYEFMWDYAVANRRKLRKHLECFADRAQNYAGIRTGK